MRQFLSAASVVILVGCATATPDMVREQNPGVSITLSFPPGQAAACMARNMERAQEGFIGSVRDISGRPGVELIIRMFDTYTVAVADVEPQGSGSSAKVWSRIVEAAEIMKKGC